MQQRETVDIEIPNQTKLAKSLRAHYIVIPPYSWNLVLEITDARLQYTLPQQLVNEDLIWAVSITRIHNSVTNKEVQQGTNTQVNQVLE